MDEVGAISIQKHAPCNRVRCHLRLKKMPREQRQGIALPRTRIRRNLSAHSRKSSKALGVTASVGLARPSITSPVVPSTVIRSPSRITLEPPRRDSRRFRSSTTNPAQPVTHARLIPRATNAAWLVMPPWVVKSPTALRAASKSSMDVSRRIRTYG